MKKSKGYTPEQIQGFEDALYSILNSNRLEDAKETAAEALDEVLEEFLNNTYEAADFGETEFGPDGYSELCFEDERY